MANHIIIQARDALISRLSSGVSAVSGRVYRRDQAPQQSVPYLMVSLQDDQCERISVGFSDPDMLEDVMVGVSIDCVVAQSGDAELAAYNLRRDVEAVVFGSRDGISLGGLAINTTRTGASPSQNAEVENEVYAVSLQLQIQLRHLESHPDSFEY